MDKVFDCEAEIDRRQSDSFKWQRYQGTAIIPMWVADMDFASPVEVSKALIKRAEHGLFGYCSASDDLGQLVVERLLRRYGWRIEPKWIVWLPGLVSALNVFCRMVGKDGDRIMATPPVYPPFLSAPSHVGRELQTVPLHYGDDNWAIDFKKMEAAVRPDTRALMLCHPHNPVSRVWRHQELLELAAFCERHDLLVCSDEIHCELLLDEQLVHIPFASLSEQASRRTVTLMSASKTFNLAGLGCAFAIIKDESLRRRYHRAMAGLVPHVNIMGYVAMEAAYRHGEEWHQGLLRCLRKNRDLVGAWVRQMPGIRMHRIEATYLAFLDLTAFNLPDPVAFLEKEAAVGLSDGADFGAPGFVRLNFGCPPQVLQTALDRMEQALAGKRRKKLPVAGEL
jgi:cystathionine beta-lyase